MQPRSPWQRQKRRITVHKDLPRKRLRFGHSPFRSLAHTMEATSANSESNKRARLHEAQMIPGLGPLMYGFPNSIITKLRYVDFGTIGSTTGSIGNQVWAANGLYDPDITGVGHQPMFFDQYAAIYDQYVVIGSKITVSVTHSSSTNVPSLIVLQGDDDATNASALNIRAEQNSAVHRILTSYAGGHNVVTLSSTFEPLDKFGVDAKDDGASATSTVANPTELWCYQLGVQPMDTASSVSYFYVAEIEYTVKWTELRTNGGS